MLAKIGIGLEDQTRRDSVPTAVVVDINKDAIRIVSGDAEVGFIEVCDGVLRVVVYGDDPAQDEPIAVVPLTGREVK